MNCPLNPDKKCNNHRSIKITELVGDGEFKEMQLCEECGFSYLHGGQPLPKLIDSVNLFMALLNDLQTASSITQPVFQPFPPCPACGFILESLVTHGRLGCPYCYTHFESGLHPLLTNVQPGSLKHIGKRPKTVHPDPLSSVAILQKKLAKAVQEERYEDAARFRDAIKEKTQS